MSAKNKKGVNLQIDWLKLTVILLLTLAIAFLTVTFRYSLEKNNFKAKAADNAKYPMRERIGYGYPLSSCSWSNPDCKHSVEDFQLPGNEYYLLNAGWYFDWSGGFGEAGLAKPEHQLDYMALAGNNRPEDGVASAVPSDCSQNILNSSGGSISDQLIRFIYQNYNKYPNGMNWSIGNEIGFDDLLMSPADYAIHFALWRNCLKQVNPTFKIGLGAVLLNHKLPAVTLYETKCVPYNYTQEESGKIRYSGYLYFQEIINNLKSNPATFNSVNQPEVPDFITGHVYTMCQPNTSNLSWKLMGDVNHFKTYIRDFRTLMKNNGLQSKDLIIKEYGPLYEKAFDDLEGRTLTEAERVQSRINYMNQSFNFFATETDPATGSFQDGNRLVQKWAWFTFAGFVWPGNDNKYGYLGLLDRYSKQMTALGNNYITLVNQLTSGSTPTPTTAPLPTATPTQTILPTPTVNPTSTPTPVQTQYIINGNFEDNRYKLISVLAINSICDTPSVIPTIPFGGTQTRPNFLEKTLVEDKCILGNIAYKWGRTGSLNYPTRFDIVRKTDNSYIQQVVTNGSSEGIYQFFYLTPGKDYLIEADLYVEKGKAGIRLSGSDLNLFSTIKNVSANWQSVSLTVNNPQSTGKYTIRIISRTTNSIFYIDNVKIRQI